MCHVANAHDETIVPAEVPACRQGRCSRLCLQLHDGPTIRADMRMRLPPGLQHATPTLHCTRHTDFRRRVVCMWVVVLVVVVGSLLVPII